MAAATLTIRVDLAPDMRDMLDYVHRTLERFEGSYDRRVLDFVAELRNIQKDGLVDAIFERGGISAIPGDEFSRLVAKMRAVERAVFG